MARKIILTLYIEPEIPNEKAQFLAEQIDKQFGLALAMLSRMVPVLGNVRAEHSIQIE